MAVGPLASLIPVYTLSFAGNVTLKAHLAQLTEKRAASLGLEVEQRNLVAQCVDPKEGDVRIQHDMTAVISPDWDGLAGTLTVKGQPDSSLIPVTRALGRVYYGVFTESATSASNDLTEAWTRIRRTRTGIREDTKAPIYSTQTDTVMLKLIRSAGDETGDTSATSATVIAQAGTLKVGDVLRASDTYVVVNTPLREGEFERAELRLA